MPGPVCETRTGAHAGFWLENLTDVFITLAFPTAEAFGVTFGIIFAQRVAENMAYLWFQLDIWFAFRVWIKGKFKSEQVRHAPAVKLPRAPVEVGGRSRLPSSGDGLPVRPPEPSPPPPAVTMPCVLVPPCRYRVKQP